MSTSATLISEPRSNFLSGMIQGTGRLTIWIVTAFGEIALFAWSMFRCLFIRWPRRSVLLSSFYQVGVQSLPVVVITGTFIGMVLAVQSYDQFRMLHMENRLGSIINITLLKELGPVMAAIMLAGRVGSSIAAELGTMRVTEQIDAIRALGANPVQYLVLPRFLACFLLIPLLTGIADFFGILGGYFFSTQVLGINSYQYWHYTQKFVTAYDLFSGLLKSIFFGGVIAIVSCHRGFCCGAGAEGVGRAATESFVLSFMAILILDFLLGMFLATLYYVIWPMPMSLL